MAFTTWQAELDRWKNALAERNVDTFFLSATENRTEMRTMYTKYNNIIKFTEWLENKAAMESVSSEDGGGGILLSVGGA